MDPARLYPNSPDLHRKEEAREPVDPLWTDEVLAKAYPSIFAEARQGYWSMEPPQKPKQKPERSPWWPLLTDLDPADLPAVMAGDRE